MKRNFHIKDATKTKFEIELWDGNEYIVLGSFIFLVLLEITMIFILLKVNEIILQQDPSLGNIAILVLIGLVIFYSGIELYFFKINFYVIHKKPITLTLDIKENNFSVNDKLNRLKKTQRTLSDLKEIEITYRKKKSMKTSHKEEKISILEIKNLFDNKKKPVIIKRIETLNMGQLEELLEKLSQFIETNELKIELKAKDLQEDLNLLKQRNYSFMKK